MPNPNITPLAQDFTVAARVPDPKRHFFHNPNLARLGVYRRLQCRVYTTQP